MSCDTWLFTTRYWRGQLLEADDFRLQEHTFEQVRWWHARAMHDAVGVAHGLETAVEAGPPRMVKVSPGLAYDGFGRELMITADTRLPLPEPAADGLLLVLSWADPRRAMRCACGCRGAAVTPATLSWIRSLALTCSHVVIGQIRDGVVRPDFRPLAVRPLRRPQLATGETSRTNTAWEPWVVTGFDASGRLIRKTVGIQTRVDTTAAGFVGVPHYFARHLWNQTTGEQPDRFSPAFPAIDDPQERRFTYRLLMEGIVRQAVDVAAPLEPIEELDFRQGVVLLGDAHGFLAGDLAVRLEPTAAAVAHVTAIDGDILTLSAELERADDEEQALAWAPGDRTARIESMKASAMRLQVKTVAGFEPGDVVVRVARDGTQSTASTVEAVEGSTIVLGRLVEGLQKADALGRAEKVATAIDVNGADVVIDSAGAFSVDDIVVVMSEVPQLAKPSAVTRVSSDRTTITLRDPIAGLIRGSSLGKVMKRTEVSRVTRRRSVIVVDRTSGFRKGDLVGPVNGRAVTELAQISGNELTLSGRLDELAVGGRIGAVMATNRYTIVAVADNGRRIRIAADSGFRVGDLLLRVAGDRAISLHANVQQIATDGWLTLAVDRSDLAAGEVVSIGRLPAAVTVDAVSPDGSLQVSQPDVVRTGDLLRSEFAGDGTAKTERVSEAASRDVRFRRPLTGIEVDDVLTLVPPMAAVTAAPQRIASDWEVPDGSLFRIGDAIGPLAGWRSAAPYGRVQRVTGGRMVIDRWPDGALPDDRLGFADLAQLSPPSSTRDNTRLRLVMPEQVEPGERIILSGVDDITGRGVQLDALVFDHVPDTALVDLRPSVSGIVLRPERMTAAALYNPRFADLFAAYARKQGLYVAWLGCQHDDTDCPEEPPQLPCCREREA